jgi:thiol-disulfide isomerase/thioredoxin
MEGQPKAAQGSGRPFGVAFFVVVAAAVAFTLVLRLSIKPSTLVGRPAPVIRAEGWLNGPGPTEDELQGKVVVLDAWAYWCEPCRRAAPEMLRLYEEYHPKGVVFLGLTIEGVRAHPQNRKFLDATGIPWPNGYGAVETLEELHADFIPQVWVINRQNQLVWDINSNESIEAVIERALKESR